MRSIVGVLIGIAVVALVSTMGDIVWYGLGVEHRATAGIVHGAVLLTAVGGVLGVSAGQLVRGLPIGTAAGVGGALAYYALAPVLGGQAAMVAAWAALWVLLAVLDGRLLRRGRRSAAEMLTRGLVAALAGGLAFALVVGTIWGRPGPEGRNYLTTFCAWMIAWAPGILALTFRAEPGGALTPESGGSATGAR
jgi:hypothetical protein